LSLDNKILFTLLTYLLKSVVITGYDKMPLS